MNPPPSIWFFVSHGFELAALIAGHTWCGDAGMSMWVTPSPDRASITVHYRWGGSDRSGLANSLDAQLIRG